MNSFSHGQGDPDVVRAPVNEQEDLWRLEFEYAGYGAVKRTLSGANGWDEPRRQFALRWLKERENEIEHREKQMQLDGARIQKDIDQLRQDIARVQEGKVQTQGDTRQMLWVAVAAIVISVISLCVSIVKK
jgi:hypothetical protein